MTTTQSAPDVTAVREVLAEYVAAHAARDAERILACFTDDAVRYTLAPPLAQEPGSPYGSVEGLGVWLSTFDGPVVLHHRDPAVVVGADVAFVHTLTSMTATPAGAAEPFTLWFRSTFGLRRIDGAWRLVHQHDSTPFHMDGSFRAATDLEP
ncbi:YybH family protein [Actinomycetospora sp. CA-101289]|uniref:YybH family protein n=1 Tax=Actinomycetospora sp. CA-101289 TaxID=3239893 RepID=UPI003D95137A